jgi:hypothetical protein
MVNELRKNIGRSMRYVDMNEQIDNQIKELEKRTFFDLNAEAQINALKQQKAVNEQLMRQPMTAQEYEEYDDNGEYIGHQTMVAQAQNLIPQAQNYTSQNNGIGRMAMDGINHLAQGMTLGWSDELHGVMGGVKNMYENWRGNNLTGDNYIDTFKQGYQEYRDASRQELNDGYVRNPVLSGLAEIGGALASPIKPFSGMTGAATNGVIGGVGMTDTNNPAEYALNIGLNTAGSVAGEKFGSMLGQRLQNLQFGFSNLSKPIRVFTKAGSNGLTNQINSWRKDETTTDY